jgi:serine/threonine protein kinase
VDIGKLVGTPQYLAPEAFEGLSSMEVDLWSLGVLMCVLLSGSYPYAGSTPKDLLRTIKEKPEIKFEQKVWKKVSPEGKDLVSKLLKIEPKKRIKACDALEHAWFVKFAPKVASPLLKRRSTTNLMQIPIPVKEGAASI